MFPAITKTLSKRCGVDRAIWIALLCVLGTAIFSTALVQLALGVLTTLWLLSLCGSRGGRFRSTLLDLPMAAFVLGRILSVPFSTDPQASVPALYIEIVFYAAFFVFTNVVRIDRENEMIILLQLLVLTAVVAAFVGGFRYMFGISPRASSSTSGTYTLGLYLVSILPLVLFLTRKSRFFTKAWYAYLAAAILVCGVIFTFDRLHWIVMGATFVAGAIIGKDRRPLIVFALATGVLILVVPSVSQRFQTTLELFSHMSDRDLLWRGAGMLWSEHPFVGFGPRTFRTIFPLLSELADGRAASWHNDFLQVYMESGLVGLLPLLWLIGAAVSLSIRAIRSRRLSGEHHEILVPLLVSLSIFVIAGGMLDTIMGLVFRFDLAVVALIVTGAGSRENQNQPAIGAT